MCAPEPIGTAIDLAGLSDSFLRSRQAAGKALRELEKAAPVADSRRVKELLR